MAFGFLQKITRAVAGRSRVDDSILDAMEEVLVESDMGVETTLKIIDNLEERVSRDRYMSFEELLVFLKEEISSMIVPAPSRDEESTHKPHVVLVVGVNGVGKTTTIGKLAHMYGSEGKKVMMGAADTFRAAAVDQLQIWAERSGADIVRQQMGSDPASVAFDTVKSAVAKGSDVVLIDTAGRLHNRTDLMNELTKIRNVIRKVIPDAPHEVLLVLDASTGQNAFQQAGEFSRATDITGLAVTKLDGTAKGGVLVGLSDRFSIPVKYVGTGEGIGDLAPFDKEKYLEELFSAEDIRKQI